MLKQQKTIFFTLAALASLLPLFVFADYTPQSLEAKPYPCGTKSVRVTWRTPSSTSGIIGFDIYRDGERAGGDAASNLLVEDETDRYIFQDNGQVPGSSHNYTVVTTYFSGSSPTTSNPTPADSATVQNLCPQQSCPFSPAVGRTIVNFPQDSVVTITDPDANESDIVPATLPVGRYSISLASYDNHTSQTGELDEFRAELNEQWYVTLHRADGWWFYADFNNYLPDLEYNQDSVNGLVNASVTLDEQTYGVSASHRVGTRPRYLYSKSVKPVCAAFDRIDGGGGGGCFGPNCGGGVVPPAPPPPVGGGGTGTCPSGSEEYTGTFGTGCSGASTCWTPSCRPDFHDATQYGYPNWWVQCLPSSTQLSGGSCTLSLPLGGSLSGSPNPANTGQTVTWTALVTGGTAPYTYIWSGTNNLSGSGQSNTTTISKTKVYSTVGDKDATISVTSADGQVANIVATLKVKVLQPLSGVTCTVSPSTVRVGEQVTWSCTPNPPGTYTYNWGGDEGLSGSTLTVKKTYTTVGVKQARFDVLGQGSLPDWTGTVNVQVNPKFEEF